MKLRAVVDIGSNSVKYTLAEITGGQPRILGSQSWVTRLGSGAAKRELLAPALESTRAALHEMKAAFDRHPGVEIRAVATSAVRDARNPETIVNDVATILGVPLKILTGHQEAELSQRGASLAARLHFGTEDVLFIDIGGASTEVGTPEASHSFQAGAVRCLEPLSFDQNPIQDADWTAHTSRIRAFFPEEDWERLSNQWTRRPTESVTVGGTLLLAAKLLSKEGFAVKAQGGAGYVVSAEAFRNLNDRLRRMTLDERLTLPGMEPGRTDIVCSGIAILNFVLERTGHRSTLVTGWGLRYGLLLSENF